MRAECANCPVEQRGLTGKNPGSASPLPDCVFHPTRFRKGQILFSEGGEARHLFALRSGVVKIVKPLENGKDRITQILFPGDIFGFEVLTESTYPLTAIVLKDAEICLAPRDAFLSYLRSDIELALRMVRFLIAEAQQARLHMAEMSFKDARMRVATLLISLAPAENGKAVVPLVFSLPFSSQEMGEVLELSPETVSRTLGGLEREGLIQKRGRHVSIPDLSRLRDAARR
jgi:CRP-like cAMP-binding protein